MEGKQFFSHFHPLTAIDFAPDLVGVKSSITHDPKVHGKEGQVNTVLFLISHHHFAISAHKSDHMLHSITLYANN